MHLRAAWAASIFNYLSTGIRLFHRSRHCGTQVCPSYIVLAANGFEAILEGTHSHTPGPDG